MRTKYNLPNDLSDRTWLVTTTGTKCQAITKGKKKRDDKQLFRLFFPAGQKGGWKYPAVMGNQLFTKEELYRDGVKTINKKGA